MKSERAMEYLTTPMAPKKIELTYRNITSYTPKDLEKYLKKNADHCGICSLNLPVPPSCNELNAVACYVPRIILITLLKWLVASGKIVPLTRDWDSSYGHIAFKLIYEGGD